MNLEDEIIRESLVTHQGKVAHPRVAELLDWALMRRWRQESGVRGLNLGGRMLADFISNLYVFILAGFVGFELISRVSPLLHTPLMSLTNATRPLRW